MNTKQFMKKWNIREHSKLIDLVNTEKWLWREKIRTGIFSKKTLPINWKTVNNYLNKPMKNLKKMIKRQVMRNILEELANEFKKDGEGELYSNVMLVINEMEIKYPVKYDWLRKFVVNKIKKEPGNMKSGIVSTNDPSYFDFSSVVVKNWKHIANMMYAMFTGDEGIELKINGTGSFLFNGLFRFYTIGILTENNLQEWSSLALADKDVTENRINADYIFTNKIVPIFESKIKKYGLPIRETLRAHGLDITRNFCNKISFWYGPSKLFASLKIIEELEKHRPGSAFNLYKIQGLLAFYYFELETLIQQADNLNSEKKYGIFLKARWEYQTTPSRWIPFTYITEGQEWFMKDIEKLGYLTRIIEVHDIKDAYKRLMLLDRHFNKDGNNKIKFIVISGHGDEEGVVIGNEKEDLVSEDYFNYDKYSLKISDSKYEKRIENLKDIADDSAQIVVASCKTGEDGRFAYLLAKAFRRNPIYSSKKEISDLRCKPYLENGTLKFNVKYVKGVISFNSSKYGG